MLITISELTPDDLALIPIWAANIRAEQFTSRLYPKPFRPENPQLPDPGALAWFAILADGQPVGHIWLEREISEIGVATLGILIGKTELLGKGIEHCDSARCSTVPASGIVAPPGWSCGRA